MFIWFKRVEETHMFGLKGETKDFKTNLTFYTYNKKQS